MENNDPDRENRIAELSDGDSEDLTIQAATDAVLEIVSETEIRIEREEAMRVAEEILEKYTSPLMIQRAAGATSSVSVTGSPTGGMESASSVKRRNILFNLKEAAFALPATLPALLALYEKVGKPDQGSVHIAVLAVVGLFGVLKALAALSKIQLTKQAAGVLHVMWATKIESEDVVPHDGLLEKVNSQFETFGWQKVDETELISYLETLERIECIERVGSYDSIATENIRWRLKEHVKFV